ncbi:MAG TPA: TonB-dependent siderophore receptor [Rhizomicrobium sp.]|jgi:catecholate siderophore receptor|nr:TonB-dependent siderophore receptor [Rhizomicrobium sp.]
MSTHQDTKPMLFILHQPSGAKLLLSRLLTGTALSLGFAASALAQTALPPMEVKAEQTGSYTAATSDLAKLTEPLQDTPISVTTVTQQLMQDRGDTNLNDALRNVPSITLQSSESSWEGNAPFIRGFSARTDMFVDGMRDIGMYYRDPFNLDKVEVLEGPDSILFGRGSTGGVVEQDSKMPSLDQFISANLSGGTNDLARATADINIPIEGLGLPAAARINLMADTNGVAGRDLVNYNRFGLAPSLALGLGEPTRVTFSYFYQQERDRPDFGVPWYFGTPAAVPRNNYYGFRTDKLQTTADMGTVKVEHDLDDWITVRDQSRYAAYTRYELAAKPGLAANVTPTTPLSSAGVALNSFSVVSTEKQFQNQIDALMKFVTGPIAHDMDAGFEYDWESSDPKYYTNTGLTNTLLNPNENQTFRPALTYQRVNIDTTTNTEGAYATDTLKLGDAWQAILGARVDRFSVHFNEQLYSVPPATTGVVTATNITNREDTLPSWHAALLYKPAPNGTFYFTYGTSFNPSAETLDIISSFSTFSLANENLSPERNRTFELGTKWSLMDGALQLDGSLFETDKVNARIPSDIPGFNILGGDEQAQGFELIAQGKITDEWNVSVGYDYLSSGTTRTAPGGPPIGLPLVFAPHDNLTFWTTYQILPDIQVGGGGQYMGSRYAQTTAPIEQAPSYVTLDAMAKWSIDERFDLQVNVYNLTDKYYYDMMHFAFVVPGAGRSAMFTLNFHQ